MFMVGIITSVALLLYEIIAYFSYRKASGIIDDFRCNITNAKDFFSLVLDLFVEYIWNQGIWLVIFYYTPSHLFISEYISQIIYYYKSVFQNSGDFYTKPINIIIFSIFHIIILFFFLVINEVIILNFCGLDFYTRIRITKRGKKESNYIIDEGMELKHSLTDETED